MDKMLFFVRRPVQITVPLTGESVGRGTGGGGAVRLGGAGIGGKLPITDVERGDCEAILSIGGGWRAIGAGSRFLGTAGSEKARGAGFLGVAAFSPLNSSTFLSSLILAIWSSGFGAASAASRVRSRRFGGSAPMKTAFSS